MKNYKYKITVDYLEDKDGNLMNQQLQFNAPNHDDIFHIIELMKTREGFTPEMAQRFAVGLKLMTEVMMENRENPLFKALRPQVMEMMKIIKGK